MRRLPGLLVGCLIVTVVGGTVWAAHRGEPSAALPANAVPVLVELFSSEGCSSCPPAEAWLASIDRAQPIEGVAVVVLEEHVDYWDRLGWRDVFALPQLGTRQQAYSRVLPDNRVFTPEIVIDGHALATHGDEARAAGDMRGSAGESRARVALARHGNQLTIDVSEIPGSDAEATELWLAVTESGLVTDVAEGENAGRRLAHAPVVRALRKLGSTHDHAFHSETALAAEATWAPRALRIVAFVQRERSKRIVGVGAL